MKQKVFFFVTVVFVILIIGSTKHFDKPLEMYKGQPIIFSSRDYDTTALDSVYGYIDSTGVHMRAGWFDSLFTGFRMLEAINYFDDEGAADISTHTLSYPIGHYRNGKTYVTFFGKYANYYVMEYDHENSQWNYKYSYCQDNTWDDSHNNPTIFKDTAGYVHLFVGHHDWETYHYRSAVNDISSYSDIGAVSGGATYPQTHEIADSLIQFFRQYVAGDRSWVKRTSDDYGTTWSASDVLFEGIPGVQDWYISSFEKDDNIHFAITGNLTGLRRNVYYAYMTPEGDLKNIEGTTLSKPITHAIADASCLVYNSGTQMIYTPHVSVDGNGNPYILFDQQVGGWTYKSARWTGSEWEVNTLTNGSGFDACNAINAISENRIEAYIITDYLDRSSGDYVFGGTAERWISTDTAKTWSRDKIILVGANVGGISVVKDCCNEAKIIFSTCTYGHRANNEKIYLWGEKGFIKRNEGIARNEIALCDNEAYIRFFQSGDYAYIKGENDNYSQERTLMSFNTTTGLVDIPNFALADDSTWEKISTDLISSGPDSDHVTFLEPVTFPPGQWAVDQFYPFTNDSATSYIGVDTNPYGSGYFVDFNISGAMLVSNNNFADADAVGGTGDAITLNFFPDFPILKNDILKSGLIVRFVAEASNTGATTLTIDGKRTKPVYEASDISELEASDIKKGMAVELLYDGTQWQQISQSGN